MAAAATKKNQQTPPAAGTPVVDPQFEWEEKDSSYVLRLALPGFRKDDFRVQVNGAGRLIVSGTRAGTAGPGSLHKVFQLPSAASLDGIAGRFEAGVLTLTMPKRASSTQTPTSIEEIKSKQPGVAKETKPKEEEIAKEDALKKKAIDEAANKADQEKLEEEEAKSRKQEQQKKEEDVKPKAPWSAAASPPPQKPDVAATTADKAQQQKQQEEEANRRKQEQQKPAPAVAAAKEEDVKPKAPQPAAASPPQKPDVATSGANNGAVVTYESLAERVRRRGEEEEHANAAPMAAAKRAKTDGENKATAACAGWKERVQGELKVLTDMKWADGLVEAARHNKEVVAVGIAAFSLGLLVSHKLFRK